MANDLTIVASLLRDTNKKLDILHEDKVKDDSMGDIIKDALPEVLSDSVNTQRQIKQWEAEKDRDEKEIDLLKNGQKVTAQAAKQAQSKVPGWTAKGRHQANTNPTKLMADDLKEKLEKQFMVAEDNLEYQKLSYKSRKEISDQRLKVATSPAAKKEIRETARADAKKNGTRWDKIVLGIGGIYLLAKKSGKIAALGGMAGRGQLPFLSLSLPLLVASALRLSLISPLPRPTPPGARRPR